MTDKRNRSLNWPECQLLALVQAVKDNNLFPILKGALSASLTAKKKNESYQLIMDCVNSAGGPPRNVDQVKKKWNNLKALSRNAYCKFKREQRQTGGPPPTPICYLYQIIIDLMGADNSSLEGEVEHVETLIFDLQNDRDMFEVAETVDMGLLPGVGLENSYVSITPELTIENQEAANTVICDSMEDVTPVKPKTKTAKRTFHQSTSTPCSKIPNEADKINYSKVLEEEMKVYQLQQEVLQLKKRKLQLEIKKLENYLDIET